MYKHSRTRLNVQSMSSTCIESRVRLRDKTQTPGNTDIDSTPLDGEVQMGTGRLFHAHQAVTGNEAIGQG